MPNQKRRPSRYSSEWLRAHAPCHLSRLKAARLRNAIAEETGICVDEISAIFSRQYQVEHFQEIPADVEAMPLELPKDIRSRIMRAVQSVETFYETPACQVEDFCDRITTALHGASASSVTLTVEQAGFLTDLVSFALIGYGTHKSGPFQLDSLTPSISAFMPLVREELEQRLAVSRGSVELKFDF